MGFILGRSALVRIFRGLSATRRVSARLSGGGDNNGYFSREQWEYHYPDVLDNAKAKAGNAGQETILNDYWYPAAEEYCDQFGESFDRQDFLNYINNEIGDDKYNAVNIISEEAADELELFWDNSYGGDGIGPKLFRNSTVRTSVEYSKTAKAYIKTTANGTSKTITYLSGYKAGNSTTYSGGMQTFRGKILGKRVTITRKDPMKRSYR
jgi:hypothetical protein